MVCREAASAAKGGSTAKAAATRQRVRSLSPFSSAYREAPTHRPNSHDAHLESEPRKKQPRRAAHTHAERKATAVPMARRIRSAIQHRQGIRGGLGPLTPCRICTKHLLRFLHHRILDIRNCTRSDREDDANACLRCIARPEKEHAKQKTFSVLENDTLPVEVEVVVSPSGLLKMAIAGQAA